MEPASVTGANYCPRVALQALIYCPDPYLITLVVRCLLTIMFTQISSCIGRSQVEKHASLFLQA